MTEDDLAAQAAAFAEAHDLDPADFASRVRRQLARRKARGALPHKRCSSCRSDLPALAFAEDARAADGLQSTCKACRASGERRRRARDVTQTD
ncbi:hypothetical protein [Micromonospora sp. NPDC023956]|uniref:hypothetical protein n=1 Tax=Micromonospora sp. NPDC023956 TaxID=3155722 RepID=UPI0033F5AE8B